MFYTSLKWCQCWQNLDYNAIKISIHFCIHHLYFLPERKENQMTSAPSHPHRCFLPEWRKKVALPHHSTTERVTSTQHPCSLHEWRVTSFSVEGKTHSPLPSSTTNIFSPSGGSHCNLFLSNWPGIFANSPQDLFWHFNNYFEICSLCKSFLSLIKFYAVSIYAEENNMQLLPTDPFLKFGHANMHFLHLIRIHYMF